VVLLVALLMMILLGTAAFSIDVAYMDLIRGELRAATDAAARAAVEVLGQTEDTTAARAAAVQVAGTNLVGGRPLVLEPQDIVFGNCTVQASGTFTFNPGATPYRSARVTGRKLGSSPSGAVPLFFGGLLGRSEFETQLSATATYLERDLCLVIDRSDSMSGQPWQDLRAAVSDFTQAIRETGQQEMVGLVSYSAVPQVEQELTADVARIDEIMARLNPARSQTNIGGGIDMGRYVLNAGSVLGRERVMLLMTDGWHNVGTDPFTAAQRAANEGTVIHAITFGAHADQNMMRAVAEMTGGSFNHAPDGAALRQIYREIALRYRNVLTE
jgi:Flp pilus assembly protein TadG/uncharacterized protein YegL